jgi:tetratricopeptide (TPR) repeat protein
MDEELQPLEISPQDFKARLLKIRPDVHALGCQVHERKNGEFTLSWWGTRFFRARKGVFYEGIVHNRPKLINAYAAGTNVVLYHYGYSDPDVMVSKRDRTLRLLNKRIEQDQDDYGAWYYKTLTLLGQDRYDEGIETGIHALELIGSKIENDYHRLNYFGILYYAIGWAYFRKWQITNDQEFATKAYQWWITGWEKWPEDIDLNFWLCNLGYLSKNREMTELHGNAYLKSIEKYRMEVNLPMDGFVNSYNINDMAIGPRHIHMASPKHEGILRSMMRDMEQEEAA